MGIQRENGYSAQVSAYFKTNGCQISIAKTSHKDFFVAEECEFPPGTIGNLVVTVDDHSKSRQIELPQGIARGQVCVEYRVLAPF
ncbi:MAG: hypothetical protein SFX18_00260 [Pirellulales bacterium]|nr:hypothetical protein [Pirellulales bacterium]